MMKKILSCVLFVCMFSSMSLTTFAEETRRDDLGSIPVSATVNPTYTVTIPTLVELDNAVEIKAEHVLTEANKVLMVAITGTDQSANAFALSTKDGATIRYEVQKEDKSIMELHTPILFEEDGSEMLSFVKTKTNQMYAGRYKGTLTFTISYDTKTNEED